jgi:hypothetical protein
MRLEREKGVCTSSVVAARATETRIQQTEYTACGPIFLVRCRGAIFFSLLWDATVHKQKRAGGEDRTILSLPPGTKIKKKGKKKE